MMFSLVLFLFLLLSLSFVSLIVGEVGTTLSSSSFLHSTTKNAFFVIYNQQQLDVLKSSTRIRPLPGVAAAAAIAVSKKPRPLAKTMTIRTNNVRYSQSSLELYYHHHHHHQHEQHEQHEQQQKQQHRHRHCYDKWRLNCKTDSSSLDSCCDDSSNLLDIVVPKETNDDFNTAASRSFFLAKEKEKNISTVPHVQVQPQPQLQKLLPIIGTILVAFIIGSSVDVGAVEIFDGSTIRNPIIISTNNNILVERFVAKIGYLLFGEIVSGILFTVIVAVLAQQLLRTVVSIPVLRSTSSTTSSSSSSRTTGNNTDSKDSTNIKNKYYIRPDWNKLVICFIVDSIGTSSYLVPFGFGEVSDIVWAPIAGLILKTLYGSNVIFVLEIIEEIVPFVTDIIPLATICWIIDTFYYDTTIAKLLQLGRYKTTFVVVQSNSTTKEPLDDDE